MSNFLPPLNCAVSPPPPAEFVVRFQWFVGGKVLLSGEGVSGAIAFTISQSIAPL